ncbi:MAG TPA: hypothetical protein DGG95_11180, partial [Cytophagales bacterium]|nr:hypothetical protein [Cytophagales bacterium]
MQSIFFWKSWNPTERFLFWVLGLVLAALTLLFWIYYFSSPAPAITYEQAQQVQSIETVTHSFSVCEFSITVPAESFLIFESIFGSPIHPAVFTSYFFLAVLGMAFVFFLSMVTELSRYRFLMAMAIVMLFLASLQLDELMIFGIGSKIVTISWVIIFALVSFYFHAIKTNTTFLYRLINFSILTVLAGVIIKFFSQTELPLLHVATNGLVAGMVVLVIFVLTVSHEIVAAFVTIITRSLKSPKSLQHFLILTSIYLINLFLMLFSKMGVIQWSFFSVSPFFLLTVSVALGIWGVRQRAPVQEDILPNEPLRIFFFLSLAIISLSMLTYFISSGSDMMMDAFEDIIMAAHIGGGVIFALYIIANFAPMLKQNLQVYKVLYKPETMPHFTFRLMAAIATFAAIAWAVPWKTYVNQIVASYYNAHGDLNLFHGDEKTAEMYYQRSLRFRNQNLHAHYALANFYSANNDLTKARKEYEKALVWVPSVPGYINLSQILSQQGDQLQGALTLDEARKKFPKSGEIKNELGLSYLNLKMRDSAIHFFNESKKINSTEVVGQTNLLATSAWYNLKTPLDSVISFKDVKNNGAKVNALALANLNRIKLSADDQFKSDTSLTIYEGLALANFLVNQKNEADTALISQAEKLAHLYSNEAVRDPLLVSTAHAWYAQGQVSRAMKIMQEIAFTSSNPRHQLVMGLWLLEQENPLLAMSYFNKAAENKHPAALYFQAIAETEADSLQYAVNHWDSLRHSKDKSLATLAEKMVKVLTSKPDQVSKLGQDEKYFFCR